jgi:hypothetical protein
VDHRHTTVSRQFERDSANVSVTVVAVNDPPVAANDGDSVNEDAALNIAAPGVLGNDGDVDGDALTAVLVSGPSHGALVLNASGGALEATRLQHWHPHKFCAVILRGYAA